MFKVQFQMKSHRQGQTTVNKMLLTDPKFADVRHAIHSEMCNYAFNVLSVDEEHTRLDCNRSWSMWHNTLDYSTIIAMRIVCGLVYSTPECLSKVVV